MSAEQQAAGTLALIALVALIPGCRRDESPLQFPGAPVILISVDTLRADHLPAYGYGKVETPHIDSLRRDAVLFERVYSHCPMTLPSHVSIFTGLLPTEHAVRNNLGFRLEKEKFQTLAEILRRNGYVTGAAVSSYVLRSDTGLDDGFDFYDDSIPIVSAGASSEHQRSGNYTLRQAIPWLQQHHDRPHFLFFHIYEPHAPYTPPEPFKSQYLAPYDGEIAWSDAIVGELIQTLKSSGVYDRSIVIFTSDHGEGLWDHGEDQHGILLYRESLQVPLLIKLPRSHRGGSTVSQPSHLAHLFGTILELTGIKSTAPSMLSDDQGAQSRPIYAETLYPRIHLGWSELRSLIDGKYHYIESPSSELYDLESDPGETKNLIATERRVAAAMRRELQSYPSTIPTLGQIDPEEAAKLAALGYIGTPRDRSGPLRNPREEVKNLQALRSAFHLADQRRFEEAIPQLRALVNGNPRLLDAWARLGEILVTSGRYDEAIETYKSAMKQTERFSPDLAIALGFAYLKHGQPAEAISHAELAVKTHPREAHELLARARLETRQFSAAKEHVEIALAREGRQPSTLILLAELQRDVGELEPALRSLDEARQRAAQLGADSVPGTDHLRGDILARLDRPEEAIAAYQNEIAHFPDHLQAYANLAVIYLIQGRTGEAGELLEQMARTNPHRGAFLLAAKTLEAFEDRRGATRWRSRAP